MTSIDQQIEQMKDLANRHFPDDGVARNECLVRFFEERLRTYAAMFQQLPVREMKPDAAL